MMFLFIRKYNAKKNKIAQSLMMFNVKTIQRWYSAMLSAAPTPAPTEKVDLDALKREVRGANLGDNGECYSDDIIDYLANQYVFVRKAK